MNNPLIIAFLMGLAATGLLAALKHFGVIDISWWLVDTPGLLVIGLAIAILVYGFLNYNVQ